MPKYKAFTGAFLTQFIVIGLMFAFGVLFKEFETQFGWSRTLLSSCTALGFFVMGVLAFFAGRLSDTYGPRSVLAFTGIAYGIGYVLMSQVTQPWQILFIFAIFVGLGMGTHDVVTLSTVARWFESASGVMTGLAKVGTAFGQMAIPPLAAFLVIQHGLQIALVILGIAAGVILLFAALLMSHPPKTELTENIQTHTTVEGGEARKTLTFRKLCIIQFLFFPTLMTIPTHIVVHGIDLGMSFAQSAYLLTTIGGASVAGRLAVGVFLDLMGSRNAYVLCFIPILVCLTALLSVTNHTVLFLMMALYGFGHGGLFAVVSPSVAGYFGTKEHGALFGTILFCGTISGALGPIVTGYAFDRMGSYSLAFGGLAAFTALGFLLVLTLPKWKSHVI